MMNKEEAIKEWKHWKDKSDELEGKISTDFSRMRFWEYTGRMLMLIEIFKLTEEDLGGK